jgi:hypothetical protein
MFLPSSVLIFALFVVLCPGVSAQSVGELAPPPASTTGELPCGHLLRTPIFLEASQALVEGIPLPSLQPRWSFPEAEASQIATQLLKAGLSSDLVTSLTLPGRAVRSDGWIHLFPSADTILSLDANVRTSVYTLLGRHEINEFYQSPVLILTDTVEEWYRTSSLRPELVSLIARLACRRGQIWAFSDLPLVLSQARDEKEARAIFKAFTRTRAYMVNIEMHSGMDVAGIKKFWSVGGQSGRLKDIAPLMESLIASGQEVDRFLDICHILPPLVRKLVYSYPGPEHAAKGILPDCHWTCLNFFNYEPHDYLLDSRLATSKVLECYDPVSPPYQYGDILFLLDDMEGNAFHSCVYLAEDLVFTKNGRNQIVPWIISTLDDVKRVYLSITPGHLQGYRQRAIPGS